MGDGGRGGGRGGSKLWPPFSVTREPGSSLTGVESEGIESLLFPFCPSGATCRGECCQCCLQTNASLEYILESAKDLFTKPFLCPPDLRMHIGLQHFFRPSSFLGSCSNLSFFFSSGDISMCLCDSDMGLEW